MLPNGNVNYEIFDVTSEYSKNYGKKGSFPFPISYYGEYSSAPGALFPIPKPFDIFPTGSSSTIVLRFGFTPQPAQTLVAEFGGVSVPVDVNPCRFTIATIDIEELVP